jgi:hypothetical protein
MVTALLVFNYVVYTKFISYAQLDANWKYKSKSEYKRYNLYVMIYIFISIVLVVLSSKFFLVKI